MNPKSIIPFLIFSFLFSFDQFIRANPKNVHMDDDVLRAFFIDELSFENGAFREVTDQEVLEARNIVKTNLLPEDFKKIGKDMDYTNIPPNIVLFMGGSEAEGWEWYYWGGNGLFLAELKGKGLIIVLPLRSREEKTLWNSIRHTESVVAWKAKGSKHWKPLGVVNHSASDELFSFNDLDGDNVVEIIFMDPLGDDGYKFSAYALFPKLKFITSINKPYNFLDE